MSRFDWGTYNATKDREAGPVYSWETDWSEILSDTDDQAIPHRGYSRWQQAVAVGFALGVGAFFLFISRVL